MTKFISAAFNTAIQAFTPAHRRFGGSQRSAAYHSRFCFRCVPRKGPPLPRRAAERQSKSEKGSTRKDPRAVSVPMMKACNRIQRTSTRSINMRASLLRTVLVFMSFSGLAASWPVPPPDPIGEHAYRTHMLAGMIPLAIIIGATVVAVLMAKARRKAKSIVSEEDRDIPP
jgi:hypothetical protein